MLKNYFKIAIRNIWKQKTISIINIAGLALGVSVCLLIAAFVQDELRFDRYANQSNQIYRVGVKVSSNGNTDNYPHVDIAVGEGIQKAYPGIPASTRLLPLRETFVKYEGKTFKENKMAWVDSNFFEIFTAPLLKGEPTTALLEPNSIVITKPFARKYFGDSNPMGKSVLLGTSSFKVTGLMDELPTNSHFHFDVLISMSTRKFTHQTWSNVGFYTYLKLDKATDAKKLEAKLPELVAKYVVPETARDMGISLAEAQKTVNSFIFYLQPLTDIHLHSDTKYELEANGDIRYVYIFGLLAIFILALACINFMNLSTAGSEKRSREVGIRKVLGSQKPQLIRQFLLESIVLTYLAIGLAYLFISFLLPYFNDLSGKNISITYFFSAQALGSCLLLGIVLGILAGLYPAFVISSFTISKMFRGAAATSTGTRSPLRSSLIVFQFAVSNGLIIATIVVSGQLRFMQDKKLGFDKEQLLYLQDAQLLGDKTNQEAFRLALLNNSRIVNASIGTSVPGNKNVYGTQAYAKEKSGTQTNNEIHADIFDVDFDYVSTVGIKVKKGRNFSKDFPTDSFAAVINESAVRDFGWTNTDPVGKTIITSGLREYKVIGVVEDFHYASIKQKIPPLMLRIGAGYRSGMIVKVKTGDIRAVLSDIKKTWSEFNHEAPLDYDFVDEKFRELYASEEKTGRIFTTFAIISVIIASLGLFALTAFITQRRTKELGVRKVFGATTQQLVLLVSKELLLLVFIAFLVVTPLAWWGMSKWLEYFAYRISISWWMFIVAGLAALLVAMFTVSFQSIKAARANPVDSLKID